MEGLPHSLYRADQVRELDRIAIEEFDIPGLALMTRAGAAAYAAMLQAWPQARRIAVVCGVGNNGGDGYIVARLAHQGGLQVRVFQLGAGKHLHGDAREAAVAMVESGLNAEPFDANALQSFDVIVDALLGTGLDREVDGEWQVAIKAINDSGVPVLSLDIPSGLHADSGQVLGVAINAHITISFIGLKQGMFTADGPDCSGRVMFDDLQVPAAVYQRVNANVQRISYERLVGLLSPRPRAAHKGLFGHVLIVGGDHGMSGAARMAAEAAARVGAGLVSIATRESHAGLLSVGRPELMSHGVEDAAELRALIARATVIAIGPGLGQGVWGRQMLAAVLDCDKPLIVDADALNLLANNDNSRRQWVLTPHPGEAARLLGKSSAEIRHDRFAAVTALQQRYGGVCVLKGCGTLICADDGSIALSDQGNPGMASGGMGDVLSGVIAGLIAQGLNLEQAACLGVCLHARAGDRAAIAGERGLLASDLMSQLRFLANPVSV